MSWNKPAMKGPSPAERHSAAIVYAAGQLIVFGGTKDRDAYNDVWSLDTNTWAWTKVDAKGDIPTPRWGHTASLFGKVAVLFGGDAVGGRLCDVYFYDIETKTFSRPNNLSGAGPNPRAYHASVCHENKLYIFGGEGADNALYALDLNTSVWQRLGTQGHSPQIRKRHSLALFGNELFLFGGVDLNNFQFLNDIHTCNLKTLEWAHQPVKGPVPDARGGHTSTVMVGKVFVWGGSSQKYAFNELHYCDPDDKYMWFKKKGMGAVPAARTAHAATLIGDKWLIFGGLLEDNKTATNDVYVLTPSGIY